MLHFSILNKQEQTRNKDTNTKQKKRRFVCDLNRKCFKNDAAASCYDVMTLS